MSSSNRLNDITSFYSILDMLEEGLAQKHLLSKSSGHDNWPQRGVYFFFENHQKRKDSGSGSGLRVTRIGTHALKTNSQTTLWKRLSQHKGSMKSGGGNHRGSIFRLLLGESIISSEGLYYPTWGQGSSSSKEIREAELSLEKLVSMVIGEMPFIYLALSDEANPKSLRGYIERNSIALLSNYKKPSIDASSDEWLGLRCNREKVVESGLWNQNHVNEEYDPDFITILRDIVTRKGE